MTRHLHRFLGGVFFVILCGATLIGLSERVAPVYPAARAHIDAMMRQAQHIEAITVGHSHNRAIDFEALGLAGWPLWVPGADISEAAYVTRNVVPVLPNLRLVLVPLSLAEFDYTYSDNPSARRNWRTMYHVSLPTWRSYLPIDGNVKSLVRGKLAPLARPDQWKRLIQRLAGNPYTRTSEDWYRYAWERTPTPMKDEAWLAGTEALAMDQIRGLPRISATPSAASLRVARQIEKLVQDLHARDIRVIFYTPPYVPRYTRTYLRERPHTLKQMRSHIEDLREALQIEYYDFAQDTSFTHHPDYFDDGNHLSEVGAEVFTRRLKEVARIR